MLKQIPCVTLEEATNAIHEAINLCVLRTCPFVCEFKDVYLNAQAAQISSPHVQAAAGEGALVLCAAIIASFFAYLYAVQTRSLEPLSAKAWLLLRRRARRTFSRKVHVLSVGDTESSLHVLQSSSSCAF